MKKTINLFLYVISVISITLCFNFSAMAQDDSYVPKTLTPFERLQSIGLEEESGLNSFVTGQHPDAPSDYITPGLGTVASPVFFALDMFKLVISTLAIIMVAIMSVRLVTAGDDETLKNSKYSLIFGIIGFILIQVADVIVKKVFFGEMGDAFENVETVKIYAKEGVAQTRGLIGMFQIALGSIAVLVLVIRGFTVLASTGSEEELEKAKKHIIWAVAGLMVIGLSEVIIRGFVFPAEGSTLPNVSMGVLIIKSITNFLAGFIGIAAFVTLLYGGYKYVVSAGNEEAETSIKKIVLSAVIALVLALGSFALVNTLIGLEPGADSSQELIE